MRIVVEADDGDEVSICADCISAEQAIVMVEIENGLYGAASEVDSLNLTVGKARELAKALFAVADAVEFVSAPVAGADRRADAASRPHDRPLMSVPE